MARKAGQRVRIAEGIYQDSYGISAIVKVRGHHPLEQRFPLDTALDAIAAWRLRARADLLEGRQAKTIARTGTLAAEIQRFLALLPEGGRKQGFVRLLGHWSRSSVANKSRAAITRLEIKEQLSAWENLHLSVSELNHRLRAIRALYRELDGEEAPNPTTGIKKRREPHREPRALPMEFVELILAHVPDRRYSRALTVAQARAIMDAMASGANACELARRYGVSETMIRKIARRRGDVNAWDQISHSKIRLRVMAWTGMPQMQLERLRPQDVDLPHGRLYLRPRRKGRGAPGVWVTLVPPAVAALRDFAAANLCGQVFSRPSLMRTWTRAIHATIRALGQPEDAARLTQLLACLPERCRPYDLRHSFLTEMYRQTGDIRATSEMAQHADLQTTKQYTDGAVSERLAAAVAKMSERWTQAPPVTPPPAAKPTPALRLARKR